MATPEAIRRCPPRIFLLRRPSHGNECGPGWPGPHEARWSRQAVQEIREEELREDHDGPDFDAAITGSRDA
jgi:hypothetical protein